MNIDVEFYELPDGSEPARVFLVECFVCSCANHPINCNSGSISVSAASSIDISSIL